MWLTLHRTDVPAPLPREALAFEMGHEQATRVIPDAPVALFGPDVKFMVRNAVILVTLALVTSSGLATVAGSQSALWTVDAVGGPSAITHATPHLLHVLAEMASDPSYAELASLVPYGWPTEAQAVGEELDRIGKEAARWGAASSWTDLLPPSTGPTVWSGASAMQAIQALYGALGIPPDAARTSALAKSLLRVTPSDQAALAHLVEATRLAVEGRYHPPSAVQAVHAMVQSVHEAKGAFQAPAAPLGGLAGGQTAPMNPCAPLFEDPLYLIRIGSPCDDVVNATARILVYDPAGNDVYHHNAGGAVPDGARSSGSTINAGVVSGTTPGQGLDNLTAYPIFPLAPTNATWQQYVLGNTTQVVTDAGPITDWAVLFAQTTRPFVTVDQAQLRNWVPVAFHIDLVGNDRYDSANLYVQASASVGGIGLLWDRAGHDTYLCQDRCQGYGEYGLALLVDEAGNDAYSARAFAQATGDGGFLIDWAGQDLYQASGNAQGGHTNQLIPPVYGGLLYERVGHDQYQAGILSQGAVNTLVDLAGNDAYTAGAFSQGFGLAESRGLLLDVQGHDTYTSTLGAAQGGATGAGRGILADFAGNDVYQAITGQGAMASAGHGLALLYDAAGNDHYTALRGQGFAMATAIVDGGVAMLLDAEGKDTYTVTHQGQGSNLPAVAAGWTAGVLVDLQGDDTYTGGAGSQGASHGAVGVGLGLLVDRSGRDQFLAGDASQGSGGTGGIGILLNGLPRRVQEDMRMTLLGAETSLDILVEGIPGAHPGHDEFVAGAAAQGASGAGGLGVLVDGSEPSGAQVSRFTAGAQSQGAATDGGIGILVNWEGRDAYEAGAASQGSSSNGLGLLADFSDADTYHATGASQGRADAPTGPALGILLDTEGQDQYDVAGNNACTASGELGLVADFHQGNWQVDSWTAACANSAGGTLILFAEATVAELVAMAQDLLFPPTYTPPPGAIFYEDFESGGVGWTATGDPLAAEWVLADEAVQVQPSPNAHSGTHYQYVGLAGGNAYGANANALLVSPAIHLAGTIQPELHVWAGGSSETGFDALTIRVREVGNPGNMQVVGVLDGGRTENPLPTYEEVVADLSAFVGLSVQVEFHFVSDSLIEDGQGWNVDDLLVVEA